MRCLLHPFIFAESEGFEGTDLAALAHLEDPNACRRHPGQAGAWATHRAHKKQTIVRHFICPPIGHYEQAPMPY